MNYANLEYVETREHVLVLEEPHHLEFPENPLGADKALEHIGKLLERHAFSISGIGDRPHYTEGAVADGPIGLVVVVAIVA